MLGPIQCSNTDALKPGTSCQCMHSPNDIVQLVWSGTRFAYATDLGSQQSHSLAMHAFRFSHHRAIIERGGKLGDTQRIQRCCCGAPSNFSRSDRLVLEDCSGVGRGTEMEVVEALEKLEAILRAISNGRRQLWLRRTVCILRILTILEAKGQWRKRGARHRRWRTCAVARARSRATPRCILRR